MSVIPEPFCTSSYHPSPLETPGASPASTTWALNLAGVDPPGTLGENSPDLISTIDPHLI
jgi:hypothetical protein